MSHPTFGAGGRAAGPASASKRAARSTTTAAVPPRRTSDAGSGPADPSAPPGRRSRSCVDLLPGPEPERHGVARTRPCQIGDLPRPIELTTESRVDRAEPRDVVRVEEPAAGLAASAESVCLSARRPAAIGYTTTLARWAAAIACRNDAVNRGRGRRSAGRGSAFRSTSAASGRQRRRPRRRAPCPSEDRRRAA